jgi:predicted enzyme related to lactoylglutathione lyase
MNNNIVGWFEIPVINMERAIRFYETVLDMKLTPTRILTYEMAMFPFTEGSPGCSGALMVQNDNFKPGRDGVMIYISSPSGDVSRELERVEAAGGIVVLNKELITEEVGYWGMFMDTEGNKIGLHSYK